MIDRKIKGVRFPPCILSNSKYIIPMTNILPPFLAHFLNHAQHRRRDIVCTDSRRGKYFTFCQKSKFLFSPILLHFQLTVFAFHNLSLNCLLLFAAITAATYSTAEAVSILPFVKNQSSYSLPFFYTFNSLFSPSILCLLIVSYSSSQSRQLPTVQQKG